MIFICDNPIQIFASIFFIGASGTLACICFATSKHMNGTNSQYPKITTGHNEAVSRKQNTVPNSAEYLGVTEQFLYDALKCYKQKYGIYTKIDNYIIYFEPCLGVFQLV